MEVRDGGVRWRVLMYEPEDYRQVPLEPHFALSATQYTVFNPFASMTTCILAGIESIKLSSISRPIAC